MKCRRFYQKLAPLSFGIYIQCKNQDKVSNKTQLLKTIKAVMKTTLLLYSENGAAAESIASVVTEAIHILPK